MYYLIDKKERKKRINFFSSSQIYIMFFCINNLCLCPQSQTEYDEKDGEGVDRNLLGIAAVR